MHDAVRLFPRGLAQPEKGFRFGADALLLACFLPQGPGRLLDLGTGCGPVALGWLLRNSEGSAVGLELNPKSAACAWENAARLGLETRLDVREGDVRDVRKGGNKLAASGGSARLEPESFDLVACNPPYHAPGTGRTPQDAGRLAAIFHGGASVDDNAVSAASTLEDPTASNETILPAQPGEHRGSRGPLPPGGERSGEGQRPSPVPTLTSAQLGDFVAAAAYALKLRGRACFVFPAERLATLLADLAACRLEPKRLRFVHPRAGEPARRVLVEARKGGGEGLIVEPPLLLYNGAHMTTDALAFCPFLSCNPVVNSEGERS
ncbi:tRNA1(Val) (adenine(37)-N6)-methyltransferase [Desulfocurvibacter africanus]|uniref:Methyltransferase small n=1 Tax=Desulfocurvibacter africanus subsp. africanus str. Walvis Bay TaxID=690850 RepID=F3YVW6_DESAF|nr:methyltransferase [Desulfocurvibacter africanus]EGJ48924.1 methyltransferase small [Desulfocurvibacter africanus subsp. africanus str. Walvis Bay]